jgi:hypothetical protein
VLVAPEILQLHPRRKEATVGTLHKRRVIPVEAAEEEVPLVKMPPQLKAVMVEPVRHQQFLAHQQPIPVVVVVARRLITLPV